MTKVKRAAGRADRGQILYFKKSYPWLLEHHGTTAIVVRRTSARGTGGRRRLIDLVSSNGTDICWRVGEVSSFFQPIVEVR